MFHTKDHKTLDMFDPLDFVGPKRRKLIDGSWAKLFREEILPDLPVQILTQHYHEVNGRPSKELHAMLGLIPSSTKLHHKTAQNGLFCIF